MPRKKTTPRDWNIPLDSLNAESSREVNKRVFGDKIKKYRISRGMSQNKLGNELGVTQKTVANWEAGVSRPEFDTLAKLCVVLDISSDMFFSLPNPKDVLTLEEREHLRLYQALSAYERNSVDTLINSILENNEAEFRENCELHYTRLSRVQYLSANGSALPPSREDIYLRTTQLVCHADEVYTVRGNSMLPTYKDGEDVLVEHTEFLDPGEIGVFLVAGELYVREYQLDGLRPLNRKYPIMRITVDDNARCIGRVLGSVSSSWRPSSKEQVLIDEINKRKRSKAPTKNK